VPEITPFPIAEIPAPKAKRGRPRKSEVRPPIPLPNGDRLVPRKQQAAPDVLDRGADGSGAVELNPVVDRSSAALRTSLRRDYPRFAQVFGLGAASWRY
jgi:hypothetical protein